MKTDEQIAHLRYEMDAKQHYHDRQLEELRFHQTELNKKIESTKKIEFCILIGMCFFVFTAVLSAALANTPQTIIYNP